MLAGITPDFPGSMAPARSCQPNISAALVVMARITSSESIPASCKVGNLPTEVCPRGVCVTIDQPRQQRCVTEIDDSQAGTPFCDADPTCLILSPSVTTAAEVSTCPLRGSSSRPALVRVTGVAVWAISCIDDARAALSSTNSVMRFRTALKSCGAVNLKACRCGTCIALRYSLTGYIRATTGRLSYYAM
jgi:hypothetical protein